MRVSPEKIKAAILSSDNVVRSEAVLYFTSATTQDPSVMDFVIQAITKFGIDEAFKSYGFCVNLAQTTTSLRWILHHESTTAFPPSLRRDLLIQAPPQFLTELAEEIRNPEFLSDNGRECLARHLAFLETPAEKLWADLKDEIATLKEDAAEADGDDDWDHSLVEDGPEASLEDEESYDETEDDEAFEDVVFSPDTQIFLALSIHADVPEELILAGLAEDPDEQSFYEDGFEDQESLLGYAIELAGRRRIEAAVPRLFELVEHYDGAVELAYSLEKCTHSLSQIGTEPIVRRLAGLFPTLSRDGRIEATWILENNPTDESVRTTLKLFETETDDGVRCKLLSSALRNFETSAIPLAREFILGKELEPNLLETRQDLLTCCDVAGEQFPELEEWRADSENDAEYANQWYMERIRSSRRELKLPWDDAGDDANQEDQFDDEDEPAEFEESVMIMPKRPHIGRNDPCPCGSGKKFKKCCYGKNEFRPES